MTRINWLFRPTGFLFVLIVVFTFRTTGQDKYFGTGRFASSGNIYSLHTDGTGGANLFSFDRDNTGGTAFGQLVYFNGLLYGTFQSGAYYWNNLGRSYGGIFSFDPKTKAETILYGLDGASDGSYEPGGGQLILYPNGKFYGATSSAGANGYGTIYSFDPATNTFTKLVDLPGGGNDNNAPSPLTFYNYKLYSATNSGGAYGQGYLFSFDPRTNVFTELYDFGSSPGQATPLTVYNDLLYGLQQRAGPSGSGLIYSFDPAIAAFTPVYSFDGTHGTTPYEVMAYKGVLYGTTARGGANSRGVIYSFDPASGKYTVLHDAGSTQLTMGGVVADSSGVLNGVIGTPGVFFKYDLSNNTYKEVSISTFTPRSGAALLTFVPGSNGTTAQALSFNALSGKTYGDPDFSAGATAGSGLPITYTSSDLTVAWTNGDQIHIVGAGTCTITATQQGNAVYAPISSTATLTVDKANLVIGVKDTVRYQFQQNPAFALTYSGFVYGDSAGSLTTLPTATTTADANSAQGQYPVAVSGAAAANYTITYQPGTLTVIGQAQDITFTDTLKTYGDTDFATATVNTGLPLTYASSNPAIAIVTPAGKIHITGAGRDTITISQAGNDTYGYTKISVVLTVLPATLSIRVNNATQTVGQPTPTFGAVYTSLVNGDTPDSLQTVFSCTGAVPGAEPGVYLIYLTAIRQQDSINYRIVSNEAGSLFITPAGGDTTSLNTWFSGQGILQVNLFVTQQTPIGQPVALQVFDVTGRPGLNTVLNLAWGINSFTLPVPNLPAGVYIVRVIGNGLNLTKKITKIL